MCVCFFLIVFASYFTFTVPAAAHHWEAGLRRAERKAGLAADTGEKSPLKSKNLTAARGAGAFDKKFNVFSRVYLPKKKPKSMKYLYFLEKKWGKKAAKKFLKITCVELKGKFIGNRQADNCYVWIGVVPRCLSHLIWLCFRLLVCHNMNIKTWQSSWRDCGRRCAERFVSVKWIWSIYWSDHSIKSMCFLIIGV